MSQSSFEEVGIVGFVEESTKSPLSKEDIKEDSGFRSTTPTKPTLPESVIPGGDALPPGELRFMLEGFTGKKIDEIIEDWQQADKPEMEIAQGRIIGDLESCLSTGPRDMDELRALSDCMMETKGVEDGPESLNDAVVGIEED